MNLLEQHVGFTGTRRGLSSPQRRSMHDVMWMLREQRRDLFYIHHGDCVGADEMFHNAFVKTTHCRAVIHPSNISSQRAYCSDAYMTWHIKPPLVRNHDIVDISTVMIACPGEDRMKQRSGTWATIRYARQVKRKLYLILPAGQVFQEN